MYLNMSSGIHSIICKSEKISIFANLGLLTAKKETDSLIAYFRIKKERIMTYTHLGITSTNSHTQALCSEQSFSNTVLQSRLKKCFGFSTKQQSFLIFSGALGLKKNKIVSTEMITKKTPKKLQYFYRNITTQKN